MRGDRDRILDMLEMCDLLVPHASGRRRLAGDPVTQGAAQRWIEVLGEAASHVSEDTKQANVEVAWREIAGIRVILAHGYFHIDQDVVGGVVDNDIPVLQVQLLSIAERLADSEVTPPTNSPTRRDPAPVRFDEGRQASTSPRNGIRDAVSASSIKLRLIAMGKRVPEAYEIIEVRSVAPTRASYRFPQAVGVAIKLKMNDSCGPRQEEGDGAGCTPFHVMGTGTRPSRRRARLTARSLPQHRQVRARSLEASGHVEGAHGNVARSYAQRGSESVCSVEAGWLDPCGRRNLSGSPCTRCFAVPAEP